MKKYYKLALLCWGLSLTNSSAQVGIPTNNPNKNAVLDLNKTDETNTKGLLLPKVALTAINDASPMTAHVAGMHIWNTATNGTDANAVTPGEYFNDGTKWIRVSSLTDTWIQDGNNNGTTKAIGTNDAFDLPIETNSTERIRITSNGQLLVNTSAPLAGGTTAKVQINNGTTAGALQIKDGTEADGKILTSDNNGVARWSFPSTTTLIQGTIPVERIIVPTSYGGAISGGVKSGEFELYSGCSITLGTGKWRIDYSASITATGSALLPNNAFKGSFASTFFSTSSTANVAPNYLVPVRSIFMPNTGSPDDNNYDKSGTGSIFIELTTPTTLYLWVFAAINMSSTTTPLPNASAFQILFRNSRAGIYGPYTYLVATAIQ